MRRCEICALSGVEQKHYKSCASSTVFAPSTRSSTHHSTLRDSLHIKKKQQNQSSSNHISKCTSLVFSSPPAFWPPPPSLALPASGAAATRTVSRVPTVPSTSATRLATGSCPPSAPAGPAARSAPTTLTPTVSAKSVRAVLSLNDGLSGGYHPLSCVFHFQGSSMSLKRLKLTIVYYCRKVA